MEKSALSICDQETHVNWSRGDDRASVYASDVTTMTKLDKLVAAEGSEWKLEREERAKDGSIYGKTYSCPVVLISFRAKRMTYSAEEQKARSERMRQIAKAQNQK